MKRLNILMLKGQDDTLQGHLGLSRLFHTFFEVQDMKSAIGVIKKVSIDMVVIGPEFCHDDCIQVLSTFKSLFANGVCIVFTSAQDMALKGKLWEKGARVFRYPVDQGVEIRTFVKEWRKERNQQPVRLNDNVRQAIQVFPAIGSEPSV